MSDKILRLPYEGDCNDPEFQVFTAGRHAISEWDFDAWRRNFNPAMLPGKDFSAEYINDEISELSCEEHIIKVGPPDSGEGDPGSNDDITFSVEFGISKIYSIPLFKGIIRLFEPDFFYFYKARKFERDFDIIFKAEKGGTAVYFGDISDANP